MKTIKGKLIASTFILVIALVVFALSYFPLQQRKQALLAFENELKVLCNTLSLTLALVFEEDNYEIVTVAIEFAKRDPALHYIAIYDQEKELIASYPDTMSSDLMVVTTELIEGEHAVTFGAEILSEEKVHGYVTISKSLHALNAQITTSQFDTIQMGSVVLFLSLILMYLIARMVANPLMTLTEATQKVAQGEYDVRVDIERKDETGILARYFNNMTEALKNHDAALNAEIVERKRAEEEADAANQAKSTFLANMSHEIRTPLNAILGFTQILDGDPNLNAQQRKSIATIGQSGTHLLALINDILDISKIEAGHESLNEANFDLLGMVQTVGSMFEMRCQQKGLSWRLVADVPDVRVFGDEGKLRQVLINMLGNSVKFTDTGEVGLTVSLMGDEGYKFEVADTGPGIPKEKQAAIFEPFQQDEEGLKKGGTGLGLAISVRHVEMMGGEMGLESEVGVGTKFFFTVPLPTVDTPDTASSEHVDWARAKRIVSEEPVRALIIDDVETNREMLAQLLGKVGVETVTAENGEQALALINGEIPDIVYADIRLSQMDGSEALMQIQNKFGSDAMKVVAVTASVFEHQRQSYIDMGFDEFLSKPLSSDLVYKSLADLLGVTYDFGDQEAVDQAVVEDINWDEVRFAPDIYDSLMEAVEMHSITMLRQALAQLEPDAPRVADHLGEMAKVFDMNGIRELVVDRRDE